MCVCVHVSLSLSLHFLFLFLSLSRFHSFSLCLCVYLCLHVCVCACVCVFFLLRSCARVFVWVFVRFLTSFNPALFSLTQVCVFAYMQYVLVHAYRLAPPPPIYDNQNYATTSLTCGYSGLHRNIPLLFHCSRSL